MPYSFPIGYNDSACYLVPIRADLVPFVAGALRQLEAREMWLTEADYEAAYNAVAEIEAAMMNNCIADLVDELRAARGIKPDFVAVDPLLRTTDMYHNLGEVMMSITAARGVLSSGWFGVNPEYATIADVVRSMQGSSKEEGEGLLGTVKGLLDTGAEAGEISSAVSQFLTAQEQAIIGGGLLTTLIAITAANLALNTAVGQNIAVQTGQLTKIIQALRGTTPPNDNILAALRGTTDSSESRNIVELLK